MLNNLSLIVSGLFLLFVGFAVSGGDRRRTTFGNSAFTLFGSVSQTFHNTGLAIRGEREKTPRDWIGWGLSAIGIVLGVVGLIK